MRNYRYISTISAENHYINLSLASRATLSLIRFPTASTKSASLRGQFPLTRIPLMACSSAVHCTRELSSSILIRLKIEDDWGSLFESLSSIAVERWWRTSLGLLRRSIVVLRSAFPFLTLLSWWFSTRLLVQSPELEALFFFLLLCSLTLNIESDWSVVMFTATGCHVDITTNQSDSRWASFGCFSHNSLHCSPPFALWLPLYFWPLLKI